MGLGLIALSRRKHARIVTGTAVTVTQAPILRPRLQWIRCGTGIFVAKQTASGQDDLTGYLPSISRPEHRTTAARSFLTSALDAVDEVAQDFAYAVGVAALVYTGAVERGGLAALAG